MAASLTQLLEERTKEAEYTTLLSLLQEKGFPISDYLPGSAGQILLEGYAFALADFSKLLPQVAAGVHAALAKDLGDPQWLDLLAEYGYDLTRARATFTKQRCRITCAFGFGPQTINPGFVVQTNAALPNRYIYQGGSGVVVADNDSEDIEFTAEFAGAKYADGVGTITRVVTELPGISVNNPNSTFGGLDATNAAKKNSANKGPGTITPSGSPALSRFYTITVLTGGSQPSTGSIRVEYEQAGVKTTLPTVSPIPATFSPGDGITLTFNNATGGFIAGDVHTFQTPGSPIITSGTDDETNESLYKRCIGRWPSLSLNIVADKYEAWVRQCSIENSLGVSKVKVRPSSTIAGQTDILCATPTGGVGAGAITTLQNYLNARDGITDAGEIKATTDQAVTLSGTVIVKADQLVTVQAAADTYWLSYIQNLDIGGDTATGVPGVVRLSELVEAVMKAGAIDYSGLQLNGAAVNLQLGSDKVATTGNLPSTGLTWTTVA